MEVEGREPATLVLRVGEPSRVGEARRAAVALAGDIGLDETRAGQVAIVVTELATNIVKHGGGGEILLRKLDRGGLELLALDRGPGMRSIAESLRDGYSTAGTAGTGLGAVVRLSEQCEVYSAPGLGTAVLAHLGPPLERLVDSHTGVAGLEVGAICVPRAGETLSGDAWSAVHAAHRSVVMVADGLGHGPEANAAATAAIRAFHAAAGMTPGEIIEATHVALRGTRGAAVGLLELDRERRIARFAGVGNIAGMVMANGATHSFVSHGGIVGQECRRVHEFEYDWPAGALLILHSDGLQTSWKLGRYPGLERRHPALLAGVLYRDYTRGRDDVTVLAARETMAGRRDDV